MSFINFLNYKKYIGRSTDAQAARIGHVNAVYDALLLQLGDPIQELTVGGSIASIDATSKRILLTVEDNVSTIPMSYSLSQPDLTPNSIIKISLVQLADNSGAPIVWGYDLSLVAYEIQQGSATLVLSVGGTAEITPDDTVKFFIEIINQ
jgi:hypothetical protein